LYLWYVGVYKNQQGKGKGSQLLIDVMQYYKNEFPIYLETSTKENFKWYQKLGFQQKKVLDLGYKLHIFFKEL